MTQRTSSTSTQHEQRRADDAGDDHVHRVELGQVLARGPRAGARRRTTSRRPAPSAGTSPCGAVTGRRWMAAPAIVTARLHLSRAAASGRPAPCRRPRRRCTTSVIVVTSFGSFGSIDEHHRPLPALARRQRVFVEAEALELVEVRRRPASARSSGSPAPPSCGSARCGTRTSRSPASPGCTCSERCAGLKSHGPRALASNSTVIVRVRVDLRVGRQSARRHRAAAPRSASDSTLMPSASQIASYIGTSA